MFKKVSEYFKVIKENKAERNDALDQLITYLPEMEENFRKIFRQNEYIDIRAVNDYKNKYKNVYDKATSYYHDGMEEKKKLPARYDEPLKKIISIYNIIDKRRETHNKNLEKDASPECINIFKKIGIEEPSKAQIAAVMSEDKHILLFGGPSTGKSTAINAKIHYLKEKNFQENTDYILLDGNDSVKTAKIAASLLKDSSFNTEFNIIERGKLENSIKSFLSKNLSDYTFKNRIVDYYINFHSYGKVIFDFNTRNEYEKYLEYYKPVSLRNEIMKSYEEKVIADFLYCSGIDYKYSADFSVEHTLNGARTRYKPDFQLPKYNLCINVYELGCDNKAFCDIDEFTDELGEERIYNATLSLNNKIEEIRALHEEAEIGLVECFTSQMQNNELISYLKNILTDKGVKFNDLDNDTIIKDIQTVQCDFLDVLTEIIKRTIETILASNENDKSIIDLSRTKSRTTSLLYKRRERILSIILPYYNHYMDTFPLDEYRFLFKATEFIKDYNISFSVKYIFVNNAENLNRATAEFINALAYNSNAKIMFSGCDWLCHNGIKGANPVYYMDFGRFYPGFKEIKFDTVFNISKDTYENIRKFALNKSGNYEFRPRFLNLKDVAVNKIDVSFNKIDLLKEKVLSYIQSKPKDTKILIACLYDNEVTFYNTVFADLHSNVKCENITDVKEKYDIVIWSNTKYSYFGFPDDRIILSDVSGIILSRPDSKMHLSERNMLCKAFSFSKEEFAVLVDDNNISNYAAELKL